MWVSADDLICLIHHELTHFLLVMPMMTILAGATWRVVPDALEVGFFGYICYMLLLGHTLAMLMNVLVIEHHHFHSL